MDVAQILMAIPVFGLAIIGLLAKLVGEGDSEPETK